MAKDKIKGTHDYLIALVRKAERKLHYEKTNEHISFNEASEKEQETEQELKDAQKILKDFETEHKLFIKMM